MVYGPHARVSFGGPLGADGEIWNCNVSVAQTTSGTFAPAFVDDLEAYLDLIQGPLGTWFSASGSWIRSDAKLAYVKANNITPSGQYADVGVTHQRDYASPPAGARPLVVPLFLSVATSWKTNAVSRGPGANGRIYLPNTDGTPVGTRVSTTAIAGVLAAGGALLELLSKHDAAPLIYPCIASTKGPVYAITSVRVGDVWDVQRRRKDKLRETYTEAPFTPGA